MPYDLRERSEVELLEYVRDILLRDGPITAGDRMLIEAIRWELDR